MNKYLFIFGLVGTALFTACSSADDLTEEKPNEASAVDKAKEATLILEAGQDSDVPIALGMLGSRRYAMTRLPLESTDFQISGGNLSVYCLATGIQVGAPNISAIPASADDIVWNDPNKIANWLVNQPAIVSYYNGTGASPITGGSSSYSYIQFWKDGVVKERYYPFGNWYSYDFFAYYPRVGDASTSYSDTGKSCFAKLTLDGKSDAIWAHASSTDVIDGVKAYSSKYIRLKKEVDEDGTPGPDYSEYQIVPEFEFQHLLSQFVFTIKPHAADATELSDKGFAVKGMKFTEIPTQLQLVVASKESSHKSGDLENLETPVTGNIKLWTSGTDADPFSGGAIPVVPASYVPADESTHTTVVGYAMVPPSKTINETALINEHTVSLEMKQNSGDAVPNTVVSLTPPTGGFLPGKIYHIEIEIFNPTKIQAKATLVGWEDVALPTVIQVD